MGHIRDYDYSLLEEVIFLKEEETNQIINFKDLFQNGNPILVEIGCGNGHFIIDKALKNTDKNFIGIDIKQDRLVRCREKETKNSLKNLKWICGDAFFVIRDLFEDNSIDTIYMTFPDPWPKRRHHKNRLFKKEFVDVFYTKLIQNGLFIFVTDHKEYFDKSFDVIKNDKRFIVNANDIDDEFSISLFGYKWRSENRDFNIFILKKST
ncbi:MAG: tRNA (guanosine(46)-N7)-methyltransferase TrmB [Spirochaetes bacterium GWD1_27_9]|nr:MAG: tRNA (guanosine(46)-N7)-methyltransferase TrmB [Spirochaetes bacterium GWB1_27_13]OHD27812.1 MAG: tRNA (guanosine(46)-N7)-methyltransferase TrmB [Spirochaetes bacterium GWC1_27_15]OHD33012.1 MAG: tRNA (guanosine(46)-N7)-methyltransferase TrmB [Spirochaetes bacterium GWD1_27_9]